jgi:hypothetical protein
LQQLTEVVAAQLDMLDKHRQQRLTLAGAVGTALVDPPTASAEPVQLGGGTVREATPAAHRSGS